MSIDNRDRGRSDEERKAWRTIYDRIGAKVAESSSVEEERELIGGQRHTYPIPKRRFHLETVLRKPRMTLDVVWVIL